MPHIIRVPATTANLGPGFDCLGLALDLWNEVTVDVTGEEFQITLEGEGEHDLPHDKRNSIFQAMQAYAQRHHKSLPQGIRLQCFNRIPLCSGLGSSSAAIVAGILSAVAVLGLPMDVEDQLDCATLIEGHPDNVAPCLKGGLVAATLESGQVIARNLPIAPLSLMVVVPDFHFSTRASRANLPPEIPRRDAVYNLGHLALLTKAFADGDVDLLSTAMQDQLHQPYRIPIIPGATKALLAARQSGAAAVALSGAGPSLIAFLYKDQDRPIVGQAMQKAFSDGGMHSRIFTPDIADHGAEMFVTE